MNYISNTSSIVSNVWIEREAILFYRKRVCKQSYISRLCNLHIDGGASGGANGGVNDGVNNGARKEIVPLVTIIMSNEGLKAIDIAAKRGKALRTTERYLKLARQYGIIEFRGAPKTGCYFITKSLMESIEN